VDRPTVCRLLCEGSRAKEKHGRESRADHGATLFFSSLTVNRGRHPALEDLPGGSCGEARAGRHVRALRSPDSCSGCCIRWPKPLNLRFERLPVGADVGIKPVGRFSVISYGKRSPLIGAGEANFPGVLIYKTGGASLSNGRSVFMVPTRRPVRDPVRVGPRVSSAGRNVGQPTAAAL
jgi:hypothetical protein